MKPRGTDATGFDTVPARQDIHVVRLTWFHVIQVQVGVRAVDPEPAS